MGYVYLTSFHEFLLVLSNKINVTLGLKSTVLRQNFKYFDIYLSTSLISEPYKKFIS